MSKGVKRKWANVKKTKGLSELRRAGIKFEGFEHRKHRSKKKRLSTDNIARRRNIEKININEYNKEINEYKD